MGYTRYFKYTKQTDDKFSEFSKMAELLKNKWTAETGVPIVNGHGETDTEPLYNNNEVIFNGLDDDAHETFYITKDGGSEFCKTQRKPYDQLVNMTLELAKNMLDDFSYSSDGPNGDEENLVWLKMFMRENKISEILDV